MSEVKPKEAIKKIPLSEIGKWQSGYAFPGHSFTSKKSGIPIVRMSDLKKGSLHLSDCVNVPKEYMVSHSSFALKKGDFLMGMSGSIENYATVKENDLPALLNQRVGRLSIHDPNVDYKFVTYHLLSDSFKKHIERHAAGAAQLNISSSQIESFEISLPQQMELQHRIAEILSTIDEAIEHTQALITKNHQIKDGMMHDLFTRGVLPNGQIRPSSSDSPDLYKESSLGWIPKEWCIKEFGELATYQNGNSFSSQSWAKSGLPIIRIQNINGGSDFNYYQGPISPEWHVLPGDLLFAWSGMRETSFGPHLWHGPESVLNQHIFKVTPNNALILNKYFLSLLMQWRINEITKSAHGFKDSFVHVTRGELTSSTAGLPEVLEQQLINEKMAAIESELSANNNELEKLNTIKTGLMYDLLEGKVQLPSEPKSQQSGYLPSSHATKLPIDVNDLLHQRGVESERIEYKTGWNKESILHTICAYANDFHNLGGGYVVIGVSEEDGLPVLPPAGIPASRIDAIQKELLQLGNSAIRPAYHTISAAYQIDGKWILVLWAPGGETRPYKAKKSLGKDRSEFAYYIRKHTSTVLANIQDEQELLNIAAKVPFDDRYLQSASLDDLSRPLIGGFLEEVKSELVEEAKVLPMESLSQQMNIAGGPPEALFPKNVGLMFFNEEPQQFFSDLRIDVVYFPDGAAGDSYDEKIFMGPLGKITQEVLDYIQRNYLVKKVIKLPDQAESVHCWNFPFPAVEEAIVNSVYHRSYEEREPIEIRIDSEGLKVLSYPGPDGSVSMDKLRQGKAVCRRYRNRRIGEFLKELKLTEGRSTGVPKILRSMKENGSPEPIFETDEDRTSFEIHLPIHKEFLKLEVDGSGD